MAMSTSAIKSSIGAAVLAAILASMSLYTVDQGQRAVILRFGAVSNVAEPGLGFKLPLIDSVFPISVQEKVRVFGGGEIPFESYSSDQQPAKFRISVNYQIPPARVSEVYANYGGEEALAVRLLDPRVFQTVKSVFGQFNAVSSIQDRAKLNQKMRENLELSLGGAPLIINGLQVEEIHFSTVYEQSVEQRMLAEVEVQKIQQNAAREKVQAEITVIKASADADATRTEAQAESDAIRMRGDAEAHAIRERAAALGENSNLVLLIQAERWNGTLPSTMVPGGAVPFISATGGGK